MHPGGVDESHQPPPPAAKQEVPQMRVVTPSSSEGNEPSYGSAHGGEQFSIDLDLH